MCSNNFKKNEKIISYIKKNRIIEPLVIFKIVNFQILKYWSFEVSTPTQTNKRNKKKSNDLKVTRSNLRVSVRIACDHHLINYPQHLRQSSILSWTNIMYRHTLELQKRRKTIPHLYVKESYMESPLPFSPARSIENSIVTMFIVLV